MHGGVKIYRGNAAAARSYVEADHGRVDDYYLAEGTGLAERFVDTSLPADEGIRLSKITDQPGGAGQGQHLPNDSRQNQGRTQPALRPKPDTPTNLARDQ